MCSFRKPSVSDAAFDDVFNDIEGNPYTMINDIVSRTGWSRGTVVAVVNILREDRAVSRCNGYRGGYAYRANKVDK